MPKRKPGYPPDYPKQCPCGHKHLSWSVGEDVVHCWDCGKYYPISECFVSRTVGSPDKASEKQLPLFKADSEPRDDLNKTFKDEGSDE